MFVIVDEHNQSIGPKLGMPASSRLGEKLRRFFLPPYRPESNTDEKVWNGLKNNDMV